MKRIILAGVTLALTVAAVALVGCASTGGAETDSSKVWGYVASADKARLEIDDDQNGVDELVVRRVVAPSDAWVVVHADMNGSPGTRVGLARVERGESLDVKVLLKDLTTPKVIVALHADKGAADEFDFDMMNKEMSPDRPYFVGGSEVAKMVTVREFGVKADAGRASIAASDQPGVTDQLTVGKVVAPTDGWVVVHLEKDGGPGQRIGLAHVRSGETSPVVVALDPVKLTASLVVALHADKGDAGLFEFDMDDKINSIDQPFFVDGEEVATKVRVK